MKKLSIVIPVYNEASTVAELLVRVISVKLPKGWSKEIIVINDGSDDGTFQILKKLKINGLKLLNHTQNQGKGAALRKGFGKATGDVLLIQDADLEYNPDDYPRLLQPIINSQTKVVYGTRLKYYPLRLWGEDVTPLPLNWVANKILTNLTNYLYGSKLSDMETCYKVFSKEVLDGVDLKSNRFEIEPEITAKILKCGYPIFEVPIKVNPRTRKQGKKIGWKDGLVAIWTLVKYRF